MSHSVLLIGGRPGSGKSTFAAEIVKQETGVFSHLSIGDHLRRIGAGVVSSAYAPQVIEQLATLKNSERLDDRVVNNIVVEYIVGEESASVTLLDGYPRYFDQVAPFMESLNNSDIRLLGLLHIEVDKNTALERMLVRGSRSGEREVDYTFAVSRLDQHDATYHAVVDEVAKTGLPVITIWSSGESRMMAEQHKLSVFKLLDK